MKFGKMWGQRLFRWYLRSFPLKDGKLFLYARLHEKMAPATGWVTIKLKRGFTLRLDLSDPDQRRLFFFGDYEERREADLISRILEPGEIFWDVGANVGYFTLLAAATLNNTGQVVAFEAGSPAFACLRANVALNPFRNILLCQAAVSDAEGQSLLFRSPASADGRANLFHPGPQQTETEVVRTVTLDGWRRRHSQAGPHFLKLDVEGAELAVLRGARETLQASEPVLLIEMKEAVCRAAGIDRASFQNLLQPLGYQPYGLVRGHWHRFPDVHRIKNRNVLWLKPGSPRHQEKARRARVSG